MEAADEEKNIIKFLRLIIARKTNLLKSLIFILI